MTSMTNKSFKYLMAAVMLAVTAPGLAQSGIKERSVYTNGFKDNWELSFGLEGLSFYSGRESGLGSYPDQNAAVCRFFHAKLRGTLLDA